MLEDAEPISSLEPVLWWKIPPENTSDFLIKVQELVEEMAEKLGISKSSLGFMYHLGTNYVIRYMDHITTEYSIIPDGYLIAYPNLKIFSFLSSKTFHEMFPDVNTNKEYI